MHKRVRTIYRIRCSGLACVRVWKAAVVAKHAIREFLLRVVAHMQCQR